MAARAQLEIDLLVAVEIQYVAADSGAVGPQKGDAEPLQSVLNLAGQILVVVVEQSHCYTSARALQKSLAPAGKAGQVVLESALAVAILTGARWARQDGEPTVRWQQRAGRSRRRAAPPPCHVKSR